MDVEVLALRGGIGAIMAAHGAGKLFGSFGAGFGIPGTAGYLEGMGFVPGKRFAILAGATELGGGLLLAAGLGTPLAAAGIVGIVATAGATAHRDNGPWIFNNGYEYVAVLGLAATFIAAAGPGRFSLDRLLGTEVSGPVVGAAALALGLGSTAATLAMRRPPEPTDAPPPDPAAADPAARDGGVGR